MDPILPCGVVAGCITYLVPKYCTVCVSGQKMSWTPLTGFLLYGATYGALYCTFPEIESAWGSRTTMAVAAGFVYATLAEIIWSDGDSEMKATTKK